MRKAAVFFVYIVSLLVYYPVLVKGQDNAQAEGIREGFESEYYYAFTEATRYMIYQYYSQAVGLYQECLEYNPGSAAIKYQLSRIYYRTGFIEEAKRYGIEAWHAEKQNRWYLINLISIYQTTNNLDSAILLTRTLIGQEPEKLENYFDLSVLYHINREYKQSLKLLNSVEENYGRSIEILTLKYNVYQSMKKEKKALDQLYAAHKAVPENTSIIGLIAEYYRDAGIQDSAERYYKFLMKENDSDPVTIFSYIDYLVLFKKENDALQYLKYLLSNKIISKEMTVGYFLNKLELEDIIIENAAFYDTAITVFHSMYKDDIRVSTLYVDINFKIKDYNTAALKLKQMMVGNEKNSRIWEQLLFAENIMNQYDSLILYGEKAISLFEDQPMAYLYTGIAYLQKKNYEMAIKVLDRGIKYAENRNIILQYCIFIAEAYNGMMNREKAFEFYEKALKIDSSNVMIMNNYAYFLALEGKDLEKAEKMSRETIKREKSNAIYLDTYAWILFKMDRELKARHYIRKALKYGGRSDNEITEHYNIIYNKAGEENN